MTTKTSPDILDGELIDIVYPLEKDKLSTIKWKTREGEIIPLPMIDDAHLRNIALFLMGMGYTTCVASDSNRIAWLTVLRMEWERRQAAGRYIWKVR